MGRLGTSILTFCNLVTYFALLNILWLTCTLFGGVVFGLAPSTVAMYAVSRKFALGQTDMPLIRTFWRIYRKEFLKANQLVLFLLIIGFVCFYDLHFFRRFQGGLYPLINWFMIVISLTYLIMLMYILPAYVHYDLKLTQCIKQALVIGFLKPFHLVLMGICGLSSYYFFITFPGFIPIFGFTLFVHINMWLSLKCFQSLQETSAKIESEPTT